MDMQTAIREVIDGRSLSGEDMTTVMRTIMTGEATQAQIGGFLVGLRMKGETVDEIAAAARVMRELASKVTVSGPHVVDIVGTGGDAAGTFNVSTASSVVAAAAGARVAKHGNRAVSGRSGAADVLEAAGVKLDLPKERLEACIEQVGVGFLFAPQHHSAMRHAIGPRREMAVRTIFNVLGPLTNPAEAPNQVVGVFSAQLVEPIAQVLKDLGSHHTMVVHADDGLDEISIGAPTRVAELRDGEIHTYSIEPEQFGIARTDLAAVKISSSAESLAMIRQALSGAPGPARDMVVLNSGAAIYVAGLADSLGEGIKRAATVIDSGGAMAKLDALIAFTQAGA